MTYYKEEGLSSLKLRPRSVSPREKQLVQSGVSGGLELRLSGLWGRAFTGCVMLLFTPPLNILGRISCSPDWLQAYEMQSFKSSLGQLLLTEVPQAKDP